MREIENLGAWCVRLLKVAMVAEVLFLMHSVGFFAYLVGLDRGNWTSDEINRYADMVDLSGMFVGGGYTLVLAICYITCGRWIYRAAFNANVLVPNQPDRITPGWSVGWYFIPFANLFKPFQAMRQIWNSSFSPGNDINAPAESALSWWWGGWIISNIIGQASYRMADANSIDSLKTSTYADFVNFPISMVAIYFFMRIIQAVTAAQTRDDIHETFA